jgi:transglutaminase-like putative cysteine protease
MNTPTSTNGGAPNAPTNHHTESIEQRAHLQATPLLDYHHPRVVRLIRERHWNDLADPYDKIAAVYTFVQNEIALWL